MAAQIASAWRAGMMNVHAFVNATWDETTSEPTTKDRDQKTTEKRKINEDKEG